MDVRSIFAGLRVPVAFRELMTVVVLFFSLAGLEKNIKPAGALPTAGVSTQASSMKCAQQSSPRLPAFSMNGDFAIGGIFSIHYQMHIVIHNYTTKPEPLRCGGR